MDYAATLAWLQQRLPMYQRVGAAALNPDLTRITALASYLGNPHESFKSIHIAGTNGKGSSAHMTAAVLQKAGYKVGLYTSPHLKDFSERIRINGTPVSSAFVVDFVAKHQDFLEKTKCSFFEMTVGMAFAYFDSQQVDVAVIEVGLGGRLDATNIIQPEACIITNISFDHQQFLGNTLEKIAKEKAGIIKPYTPVVISEYHKDTFAVFQTLAHENQAPITLAEKVDYQTDLLGIYQPQNINGVVSLMRILPAFDISEAHIRDGLLNVRALTGLRGRWEQLGKNPTIIADVAHNKAGVKLVMAQLAQEQYAHLHLVFGMVNDKDVTALLNVLPKKATYYLCAAAVPRAKAVEELAQVFDQYGFVYSIHTSVSAAYAAAKNSADAADMIFIGGSLFVVAEILP